MSHSVRTEARGQRAPVPLIMLAVAGALITAAAAFTNTFLLPSPSDPVVFAFIFAVLVLGLGAMGALLAIARPANRIGWLLLAAGILFSTGVVGSNYAAESGRVANGAWPLTVAAAWLASWTFVVALGIAAIYVPLFFPTGRLASARWRWVAVAGALGLFGGLAPAAFGPGPLSEVTQIQNPFGIPGARPLLTTMNSISSLLAPVVFVLVVASVVQRYRRGTPTERDQIKWFLYPAAVAAVGIGMGLSGIPVVGDAAWTIGLAAMALVPIAIGIAILRHRLFDIDLIINRTLVYAALSVSLGAVYVVTVLVLRQLLTPFAPNNGLVVAASTLGVVALFQPMRRRIQAGVDRRFYRSRYDAARVVSLFTGRLRDQVELTRLTSELTESISDALRPASVSVWLRRPSADR
jgi:hypothetical protein